MKKTIIGIYGSSNQGKSQTIVAMESVLINKGYQQTQNFEPDAIGEIFSIFNNGFKKIGLYSKGDPNTDLESKLQTLVNEECDIIVCATRNYGETVHCLYRFSEYQLIWATNFRTDDDGKNERSITLNQLSAQNIFNLIQNI